MSDKHELTRSGALRIVICITLVLFNLVGCGTLFGFGPSEETLLAVDYAPLVQDDWPVSTPEAEGLDPLAVAELYYNASELDTIYGLVVIRNGRLVGEDYWHESGISDRALIQSVTKSYIGALVGLAMEQGYLTGLDQRVMEFFPEFDDQITDPRKFDITIRHLLQMRAGFPWEESTAEGTWLLWNGFTRSNLVDIPLIRDPGTGHDYSNFSSALLAMILTRAIGEDILGFANEILFAPIDSELSDEDWWRDIEGCRLGQGGMHFTAREMARFGQLYLNDGVFEGNRIVSADWVHESFQTYTVDAWDYRVGPNFKDIGYGYHWWSARSGDHSYNLAWGHGGQLIFVIDDLDMVIALTADPFHGGSSDLQWRSEKANINLVANFIADLTNE